MTDVAPIPKIVRIRSPRHLARIKAMPCSVTLCGRSPVDPHHLKCGPEGGGSVRASDCWVLPLCRIHHDAAYPKSVHSGRDIANRSCDEAGWWRALGINPVRLATQLWAETQSGSEMP